MVLRRLGHGSPTITLGIYGHLFGNTDDKAADVVEIAFGKVLLANENALRVQIRTYPVATRWHSLFRCQSRIAK
jgi:hypothetical protein